MVQSYGETQMITRLGVGKSRYLLSVLTMALVLGRALWHERRSLFMQLKTPVIALLAQMFALMVRLSCYCRS
ncbi:hypothetical protein HMPREF1640_01670 [Prevotella sp. S7-1-8]|nr:hypothetical protein HMPREF1640_01670 [Prevotella sp. S7-1-8]